MCQKLTLTSENRNEHSDSLFFLINVIKVYGTNLKNQSQAKMSEKL